MGRLAILGAGGAIGEQPGIRLGLSESSSMTYVAGGIDVLFDNPIIHEDIGVHNTYYIATADAGGRNLLIVGEGQGVREGTRAFPEDLAMMPVAPEFGREHKEFMKKATTHVGHVRVEVAKNALRGEITPEGGSMFRGQARRRRTRRSKAGVCREELSGNPRNPARRPGNRPKNPGFNEAVKNGGLGGLLERALHQSQPWLLPRGSQPGKFRSQLRSGIARCG